MTNQDVIVAYTFLEVFYTYGFTGICIRLGVFTTIRNSVQFGESNSGKISTDSFALFNSGSGHTCIELVTKSDELCLCRICCAGCCCIFCNIIYSLQISQCLISDTQKAEPAFTHCK